MADPFDPGSSDPLGGQGPIPKPGQVVPPTNLPEQFSRAREAATQFGAELTGVADVRQVLSGETPWTEAIAGAIPMALGGPEARAAERAGAAAMKGNPEGVARLQAAYEKGLTLPNSGNWYFLGQLEKEFIREYGELGPEMFKQRVADALAATTAGVLPIKPDEKK